MLLKQKQASNLPANPALWSEIILADSVQRCPDLEGRIQGFRTVHTNDKGDGVCLITLTGQKAWIVAVVREFELKPIDEIFFKDGRELKAKYISKRNILKLTISSNLGIPLGKRAPKGVRDVAINMFSPSGGTSYPNNPFFGAPVASSKMASIPNELTVDFDTLVDNGWLNRKTASDRELYNYGIKAIQEYDYWKDNDSLSFINPKISIENVTPNFVTLSKSANDKYTVHSTVNPDGTMISEDKVTELFHTLTDPDERMSKIASFASSGHVIIGDILSRKGNVFVNEEDKSDYLSLKGPFLPAAPEIFLYGGVPTFLNPRVKYVDNTAASSYCMAVRLGEFTMGKDFRGFKQRVERSTVAESLDDILPLAKDLEPGDLITIMQDYSKDMTIPLKVLIVKHDVHGNLTIKVQPEVGISDPVEITFYNGEKILKASDNLYLYPLLKSKIRHLPKKYLSQSQFGSAAYDTSKMHTVKVYKSPSSHYLFKENGNTFNYSSSKSFFTLVNRYGLDEHQANSLLKRVFKQGEVTLLIKRFLDEPDVLSLNSQKEDVNLSDMEKDAVNGAFKLATSLKNGLSKVAEFMNQNQEPLSVLEPTVDFYLSKTAQFTPNQSTGGEQGQRRAENNLGRLGMTGVTADMGNESGLVQALARIPQTEKNTREMIDTLTYYALGKIKPEEKTNMIKELVKKLEDAESILCKLMLFTKLDQLPGQDYTDMKILTSDIDSFLTTISTTMILI